MSLGGRPEVLPRVEHGGQVRAGASHWFRVAWSPEAGSTTGSMRVVPRGGRDAQPCPSTAEVAALRCESIRR